MARAFGSMAGKPDYWKDVAEDISRIPVEVELELRDGAGRLASGYFDLDDYFVILNAPRGFTRPVVEWRYPAAGYVDIRRKR